MILHRLVNFCARQNRTAVSLSLPRFIPVRKISSTETLNEEFQVQYLDGENEG